jgi:hypothetical protein
MEAEQHCEPGFPWIVHLAIVEGRNDRCYVIVLLEAQLARSRAVQVCLLKERRQQHRVSAWHSNLLEQAAPVVLIVLEPQVFLATAWTFR